MKNKSHRKKIKTGFTIIETLVAIFILTVGIVGVLTAFPLGIQVQNSAKMATVADQLAQGEIEEVVSKSYAEISIGTTPKTAFDPPFNSYQKEIKVSYVDPHNNLQETSIDSGIKKIEITVSWKPSLAGAANSLKVASLITER